MNFSQNENLDSSTYLKEQYDSEYKRGREDGISTAGNRSQESGFRDGVQVNLIYNIKYGLEMGFYVGYFEIINNFIKKYPQEFKVTQR
jgi:hypothetical protein